MYARDSRRLRLLRVGGDDLHFDSPQMMGIGERHATAYLVGHADSNGNGAEDAWELTTFGNLNNDPVDIDGQFHSRHTLYVWNLPNPTGQLFRMEDFRFPTVSNRTYQVQYRESLLTGEWEAFGTLLPGTGDEVQLADPPAGFYRIQVLLP